MLPLPLFPYTYPVLLPIPAEVLHNNGDIKLLLATHHPSGFLPNDRDRLDRR